MKLARVWALVRKGVDDFSGHNPFEMAAAVSYYTLLALAPLVLVVLAMAGQVFGRQAVEGRLDSEVRGLLGEHGAQVLQLVVQSAAAPDESRSSLVIGLIMLIVGASGVFLQLQSALNRIWNVEAAPKRSALWRFLRHRLVSMAMVFGIGFLLMVSLIVNAALSAISAYYQTLLPWAFLWHGLNALGSLLVITLLNAMMFRFLPDVRLAWRDVWLGAFTSAVLFTLGKSAIGAYLGRASIGSSYGAAGSLVVLVVWVYYASLIFFVGAEITQVYGRWRETRIRPTENAVAVKR